MRSQRQSGKRADLVNRSVNNIRLTLSLNNYERADNANGVQSTTAEATISIDYMKHNLIRLIALLYIIAVYYRKYNIKAVLSQHLDRFLTKIACTLWLCLRFYLVIGQTFSARPRYVFSTADL